jgi:hypothetical protein
LSAARRQDYKVMASPPFAVREASPKPSPRCPMESRTASCYCGQLRIEVQGQTLGTGVCHCLACQQRTGSVFAALAGYAAPWKVEGTATEFVRTGDQGASFRFRFCPVCGSQVFHTEEGNDALVMVAVGAFATPAFHRRKTRSMSAAGTHGCSCPRASRATTGTRTEIRGTATERVRFTFPIRQVNLTPFSVGRMV